MLPSLQLYDRHPGIRPVCRIAYIDRMLRGAKTGDLPAQFPTKFEMAVNLTTAEAIGINIPESFLSRATEVIE